MELNIVLIGIKDGRVEKMEAYARDDNFMEGTGLKKHAESWLQNMGMNTVELWGKHENSWHGIWRAKPAKVLYENLGWPGDDTNE